MEVRKLYTMVDITMYDNEICFKSIGIIHSPYTKVEGMPVQPVTSGSANAFIELDPQLVDGLKDLDGFSHIIVLYYFHRSHRYKLTVNPFLDTKQRGLFATRAPNRPNPIGLSVVQLKRIEENRLYLGSIDILDGTPLLDIKPYSPIFENIIDPKSGWLEHDVVKTSDCVADRRFVNDNE